MAITAAMHLLFLAAFSWMLVEGLPLWSKVVAVSMRAGPRMTLYYATGWGETPLCPTPALFQLRLAWHHCPTLNPTTKHPSPPGTQHHSAPSTSRHPAPISNTSSIFSALSTSDSTQVQFF